MIESNELHRHLLLQSFVVHSVIYIRAINNKLNLDPGYFKGFSPVIRLLCCDYITKPGNNYTQHDRDTSFFIKVLSLLVKRSLGLTGRLGRVKAGDSFGPQIKHFYQFPLIFKFIRHDYHQ